MPKLRKVVEPKHWSPKVNNDVEEEAPKKDISDIVKKESVCSYCQQTIVGSFDTKVEKKVFNDKTVDAYIFKCDRCSELPHSPQLV